VSEFSTNYGVKKNTINVVKKHCTLSPENIWLTNNIGDKTRVKKKDCVDKNSPNKMLL